jgi:glycolate oxidase FAD binding subunit
LATASELIVEHEPGDLTCVVGGALRLAGLQATLAEHGQRLSLDPPGDPTIEECILDDLSGPLRHRFGTMRDLVLGVTVTLRDGTRATSGGKVVKNVAGYDLGKLFCGSRGRLGRVEQVALRLHPLPAASRTIVADATRWRELHFSSLVPSAVDVAAGRMHVLFEGSRRSVAAQAAELGGDEADPWNELRALQARLPGKIHYDGGTDAPLVRPGPRVAYVEQSLEPAWSPLAERVAEALCRPS